MPFPAPDAKFDARHAAPLRLLTLDLVDLGIVLFVIALAAIGYERGLVASALPLAGFVGGAALGARIGPALLADGAESSYAPLVAVLTGVLLGAFLAVALDGFSRGLRARVLGSAVGVLDGIGGALLLAALALLLGWGFGRRRAARERRPGRDLRHAVQRSAILGAAQRRAAALGPAAQRAAPGRPDARRPRPRRRRRARRTHGSSTSDRTSARRAARPCACSAPPAASGSRARAGSPGPGLVVTNAHVVAGEDDTTVNLEGGPELDATAVHYDTRNDLAVLAVAGPRRAGAGARRAAAQGDRRRGDRLPGERPADLHAGAAGAHRRGDLARTPTGAGPVQRADDAVSRRRPQRQLGRPGGRRGGRRA